MSEASDDDDDATACSYDHFRLELLSLTSLSLCPSVYILLCSFWSLIIDDRAQLVSVYKVVERNDNKVQITGTTSCSVP